MQVRVGREICKNLYLFNDTATTEIYTLSLHDALPICKAPDTQLFQVPGKISTIGGGELAWSPVYGKLNILGEKVLHLDRKSTRLNSSHANISYAVFCLKKK